MPRRPPPAPAATRPKAGPGRPKVHAEAWSKVSVDLFSRQVAHLDRLADKARQRGHTSVTRAGLIRALIDGVLKSGVDLSAHGSEARIREALTTRLKRRL